MIMKMCEYSYDGGADFTKGLHHHRHGIGVLYQTPPGWQETAFQLKCALFPKQWHYCSMNVSQRMRYMCSFWSMNTYNILCCKTLISDTF
jgi:hypothetical protein